MQDKGWSQQDEHMNKLEARLPLCPSITQHEAGWRLRVLLDAALCQLETSWMLQRR
jgi:hypothetical protein